MDASDLIPGLAKMIKDHFRPNDEPKDLAYWMVVSMNIAVWLTLIMLPIGALLFTVNQVTQAFSGPIETNTALRFVFWGVYLLVLPLLYFCYRLVRRALRMAKQVREGTDDMMSLLRQLEAVSDEMLGDETLATEVRKRLERSKALIASGSPQSSCDASKDCFSEPAGPIP